MFQEQFFELNFKFNFQVHAFVLMDNHYHLIASCSQEHDLGFIMHKLQGRISLKVNKKTKRMNHF
jgi:REP element-mobilizing transposase RayT